jgi:hypothetical protein
MLGIATVKVRRVELFVVGIDRFHNDEGSVTGLLKSVVCQY